MTERTPSADVLVVGAGPAGLATALSAARHGARVVVVEQRSRPSVHPRASGISTRTMEIFRTWGLADAVRAAGSDVTAYAGTGRTLRDDLEIHPTGYPDVHEALAVSAEFPVACPQDELEPLLVAELRRRGADVRLATRLVGLAVEPDGVRATLVGVGPGSGPRATTSLRARYVVGADGTRSSVRHALGAGVEHLGTLGDYVQVLFRADLAPALRGRDLAHYVLTHPDAGGLLVPFGTGRWGFARPWRMDDDGRAGPDVTDEGWSRLIRAATGLPELRPRILDWTTFTLAGELAGRYRAGRGFLVGDAAHRMTPFTAMGLNTAVQDGHNLGWKLAWAARGLAGDGLLDSYAAEREPVGRRNAERSLAPDADAERSLTLDLGARYDRPEYTPPAKATATPGERAPHVWLFPGGRRVATHDLFDGRLTLVTGRHGDPWHRAAALAEAGAPLAVLQAGTAGEPDDALTTAYRLGTDGAVLVRPDGYVTWRQDRLPVDALTAVQDALARVLALPGRLPLPPAQRCPVDPARPRSTTSKRRSPR